MSEEFNKEVNRENAADETVHTETSESVQKQMPSGSQPGKGDIRLRLETGRTHQIRVHMAYLGHPVAGDPVYGLRKPDLGLKGQCLHARLVGFVHPRDGRYLEFESPLPDYFTRLLTKLEQL